MNLNLWLKFIYSEKNTKFCEISTSLLSYAVPVKSKVEALQNFVAFSEFMNFTQLLSLNQESVLKESNFKTGSRLLNLFEALIC